MDNGNSYVNSLKPALLLLPVVILFAGEASANPSFTIGSNPYLTVFAYPHDLLRWPDRGLVFNLAPQTLPWQGDVTNIHNRPVRRMMSYL